MRFVVGEDDTAASAMGVSCGSSFGARVGRVGWGVFAGSGTLMGSCVNVDSCALLGSCVLLGSGIVLGSSAIGTAATVLSTVSSAIVAMYCGVIKSISKIVDASSNDVHDSAPKRATRSQFSSIIDNTI